MVRRGTLLAVCVISAAGCGSDKTLTPPTATVDVFTPGNVFSPFSASVSIGGIVQFHITKAADGMGHNVLFRQPAPGAPADIPVVADTVVSRQFTARGTFAYDCFVHPGMSGEVIVQ